MDALVEDEPEGLHTHYSGSADETPAAFGVKLPGGFDECRHHVEMSDLPQSPTKKQAKEFQGLFDALSAKDQATLKTAGEPRVFLLVSTS